MEVGPLGKGPHSSKFYTLIDYVEEIQKMLEVTFSSISRLFYMENELSPFPGHIQEELINDVSVFVSWL